MSRTLKYEIMNTSNAKEAFSYTCTTGCSITVSKETGLLLGYLLKYWHFSYELALYFKSSLLL